MNKFGGIQKKVVSYTNSLPDVVNTIKFDESRIANLSKEHRHVILDSSDHKDYLTLHLPDLSTINSSYVLMLYRIGGQSIHIFPSGDDTIDGIDKKSYIDLANNYDSVMLLCAVCDGDKQWLLHN